MAIVDHDRNLAVTAEPNWNEEFTVEYYEAWPVWANHMRLVDPACGSRKWRLPPTDRDEL